MKVFISWSGEKSRDVALAVHDWLPMVLHSVQPFVSSKDILAGTRWQAEVATELDNTDFGLICVTRQNISAAWLNFEAGALAKSVDSSRVVPLAVDLSPAEVPNPLGQFQASTLKKADMEATVRSINDASAASITEENLARTFEKWWPDLEAVLDKISSADYGLDDAPASPERSEREMLEEVLDSVRGLRRDPADHNSSLQSERPKLFDDIQLIAQLNDADIRMMSHIGDEYTVRFRGPPIRPLIQDLKMLELNSGQKITSTFSPDPPETGDPATPPT